MKFYNKNLNFCLLLVFSFIQLYMMATVYMQAVSPIFQVLFWGSVFVSFFAYFIPILKKERNLGKIEIIYFLYLIYILLSVIRVNDTLLMIYGMYEYIIFTMCFFSVAFILSNKLLTSYLVDESIKVFKVIVSMVVGLGLFEFKTGHLVAEGIAHVFGNPNLINIRAQVFSGSPLIFGTLTASYALFFQYLFMKKKEYGYLLLSFVSFGGVLLTGSRGPLVAVIVAAIFQLLTNIPVRRIIDRISKKNRLVLLISLGVLLISVFIFLGAYQGTNPILLKVVSIVDWSSDIGNIGRLNTWVKSIEEFLNNWLIGRGISTTGSVTLSHPMNIGVTESSILKVLVELGLVGFIFYFGILLAIFTRGIKNIRNKDIMHRYEIILGLSLMMLIFIQGSILQITEIFNASVILWSGAGGVYWLTQEIEH